MFVCLLSVHGNAEQFIWLQLSVHTPEFRNALGLDWQQLCVRFSQPQARARMPSQSGDAMAISASTCFGGFTASPRAGPLQKAAQARQRDDPKSSGSSTTNLYTCYPRSRTTMYSYNGLKGFTLQSQVNVYFGFYCP